MIRRTVFAIITAAGLLGAAAQAAPVASDSDLRCMLVASRLSQDPNPQAKNLSSIMVFYYMGRLDARRPGLNLRTALAGEVSTIVAAEMPAVAQKCVSTIEARGQVLQSMATPPAGVKPAAPATAN